MSSPKIHPLILFGAFVGASWLQNVSAPAQLPFGAQPPRSVDPAAEDPQRRETLKLIFDCEQALSEGRDLAAAELFDSAWALAVQREDPLLTLSSDATDQLKPGEHRVQAGARVRLERIYEGASTDFRKRYAEFVDVASEKAEQEALIGSRTQELERFTVRYQFTERAQSALRRLIHLRTSRGEYLQAALQYGRLLRLVKDESVESRTRLASLWWNAQLPEEAVDYLKEVTADAAEENVQLAGTAFTLPANDATNEQLLDWFSRNLSPEAKADVSTLLTPVEWLQPRGNYRRTTLQQAFPALLTPQWSRSASESVLHSDISKLISPLMMKLSSRSASEIALRRAAIAAAQPLAVGDTVVYRTPASLMAFSSQSGELLWETSNADIQLRRANAMQAPDGNGDYPSGYVVSQISDEFYHHLIRTHGAGQITSDGRFVYVVEDASSESMRNPDRSGPSTGPPFNFLRAYDLASGSLLGQAGGETGLGGRVNPMAGMFFLGAPLVMGERIYVMAENDQGIFLIELRARPMFGRTRLAEVDLSPVRSQLLTIPRAPLRSHPARKFAGIIPSYSRGLLVCGTCDERIVAVSAEDHSVRWIYRYASNVAIPEGARQFTFNSVGGQMSQDLDLENRWLDALPKIAGGRVFLTSRDSDRLICLDLQTGRELWSRARGALREIIVVDNERVVLAGAGSVEALKAESGEKLWVTDLGTFVSGRCTASQNLLHVPTVNKAVITLSQIDGQRLVSQSTGHHIPGNLLSVGGKVVSQNIAEIAVLRTPAEAADSGLARANRAFLQGQPELAEKALTEAVKDETLGKEERFTARRELIVLLLGKLKADFSANADVLPVLHDLFANASPTNSQIAEFLYGAIGMTPTQLKELPARWQELDTLKPLRDELMRIETAGTLSNVNASAGQTAEIMLDHLRSAAQSRLRSSGQPALTQSDAVLAAREVRDALETRSDELRNEIESELKRKLTRLLADEPTQLDNASVTSFLLAGLGDVVCSTLADDEISVDDRVSPVDRDRLLLSVKPDVNSDSYQEQMLRLAKHWQSLGRPDLIKKIAARSKRFSNGESKTPDAISVLPGDRLAVPSTATPDWPDAIDESPFPWQGEPKVIPSAAHSAAGTFPQRVRAKSPQWNIPLLGAPGAFAGWSFSQQSGSPLVVAYDENGRRRWTFDHGVIRLTGFRQLSSVYATAFGNILVLKIDRDVHVVDTLQLTDAGSPRELWRIRLPNTRSQIPMWQRIHQYDVQPSGHTPVGPASAIGIPILANKALTMFDLVTGRPLWRVSGLRDDTTITCDEERLCLISMSVGEVQVRRTFDGQLMENHSLPSWWIQATENTPASIRDFELEPDEEQRWRISVFRNECLLLKRTVEGAALESHSLVTNTTRWSIPLPLDSVVSNIVDGHVAVLSDGNQLQIYDLVQGVLRTSVEVSTAAQSRYLYLCPSRENWIVLTDVPSPDAESYPITDNKPVNGFAWAVDRKNGELRWEVPVDNEAVRLITPTGGITPVPHVLPILVLLKRYEGQKIEGRAIGKVVYQARFIDTASGKVLHRDKDVGINISYHGVELDPGKDRIEFSFNKRNFVFDYSASD